MLKPPPPIDDMNSDGGEERGKIILTFCDVTTCSMNNSYYHRH